MKIVFKIIWPLLLLLQVESLTFEEIEGLSLPQEELDVIKKNQGTQLKGIDELKCPEPDDYGFDTENAPAKGMQDLLGGFLDNKQYIKFIDTALGCPTKKIKQTTDNKNGRLFQSTEQLIQKLKKIVMGPHNSLTRKVIEASLVFYDRYYNSMDRIVNELWDGLLKKCEKEKTENEILTVLYPFIKFLAAKGVKDGTIKGLLLKLGDEGEAEKSAKADLSKALEKLTLYYKTTAYLEGRTASSSGSEKSKKVGIKDCDALTDQKDDRLNYMKFLIREKKYDALLNFLLLRVNKYTPLNKGQKKVALGRYEAEHEKPEHLLLLPSGTEWLQNGPKDVNDQQTVFQALALAIGSPGIELQEEFWNRFMKDPNQVLCSLLRATPPAPFATSPNSRIVSLNDSPRKVFEELEQSKADAKAVENHLKFLLTLTFMSNQKTAGKLYQVFVRNCAAFDSNHLLAIKGAVAKVGDKSSIINFLSGHGFFNTDRMIKELEVPLLVEELQKDKEPQENYVLTNNLMLTSAGELTEEHYELMRALMEFYLEKQAAQAKTQKPTFAVKSKDAPQKYGTPTPQSSPFSIAEKVLAKLIKTNPFTGLKNTGFFIDTLEEAFDRNFRPLFNVFCQEKRCLEVPLLLLERYRQSMLLLIERKLDATDRDEKFLIVAEMNDLNQRTINIIQNMNEMIRDMNKIVFAKTELGLPGLMDRPNEVKPNFNLDYKRALQLTNLEHMHPVRSAIIPWHGIELAKTAPPDVASHILVGALQEPERFYTILAVLGNTNLPLAFRSMDGLRFYLLFLLLQLQCETVESPPVNSLSLPHYPLNIKESKELTTGRQKFIKAKAALDTQSVEDPLAISDPVARWKKLDELDKESRLQIPQQSGNPTPFFAPTEALLYALADRFKLPFEPNDAAGTFSFEPLKATSSSRPVLKAPIDGYVNEFILWLVDQLQASLQRERERKAIENAKKSRGISSPRGGSTGGFSKSTVDPSTYRTFFKAIIDMLIKYMALNLDESQEILVYAKDVLQG